MAAPSLTSPSVCHLGVDIVLFAVYTSRSTVPVVADIFRNSWTY